MHRKLSHMYAPPLSRVIAMTSSCFAPPGVIDLLDKCFYLSQVKESEEYIFQ